MFYLLVFHDRAAIGYIANENKEMLSIELSKSVLQLTPVPEFSHTMAVLSDDGTYFIPTEKASQMIIVSEERLKELPIDLGF